MDKYTVNAKQLSQEVQKSYCFILMLIQTGKIPAVKQKNKWAIDKTDYAKFVNTNKCKLEALKEQYLSLWKRGICVEHLQQRANDDFVKAGIIFTSNDLKGFAERVIYNYQMQSKVGGKHE